MSRKIEVLAPGGDIDSIKAAIVAGAGAVYCGLNKFNARNRAENITMNHLNGILHLAHQYDCEVFLTLNISIVESEMPDLMRLLNKLVNTSIDGVIIQDLGLFYILKEYFPTLNIHASTQLTSHNNGQLKFLKKLTATRVNLSRELNLQEIKSLTAEAHKNKLLSEVFVHGSYCISFSGICYMSSVHSGNSGNRGRCSQPCRDAYKTTSTGNNFPLNLKDNAAYHDLKELYEVGVDSLKIEGRIKKFHYVYTVVDAYQKQLHQVYHQKPLSTDDEVLYKVFNRDFSDGYLRSKIDKNMFVDNPRDFSSTHLAIQKGEASEQNIEKAEKLLYSEKGKMRADIKAKIDAESATQVPLEIKVSGKVNEHLMVEIKSADKTFSLKSEAKLDSKGTLPLSVKMLMKRFKAINETAYVIQKIELENAEAERYIRFNEITALKNQIIYQLRDAKESIAPVELPKLAPNNDTVSSSLSVLINEKEDIGLAGNANAKFYFQLPANLSTKLAEWIQLFQENKNLIPWFQSVLLGDDFEAAIEFLKTVKPARIVANNSGVGYEADRLGISWIAGPYLNTVNSYALKCLKESFNCEGAFISNELNKSQIQRIKSPENFKLFFSMYHPIVLMTSRQCFFQTTSGCEKETMDRHCLPKCSKLAQLTDLKQNTLYLKKSKGEYNTIYHQRNYLNTAIVTDIPNRFSAFMVDLRNIQTETKISCGKPEIIKKFQNCISGKKDSAFELHQNLESTTCKQYSKGI